MDDSTEIAKNLEGLSPQRQAALAKLRALIFETVPAAKETMHYRMPTYDFKGDALCAFASQKHYMSLYMNVELVEQHRGELSGLDVGKRCIRFRKLADLPLDTARAILKETAQQTVGAL